MGLASKTHRKMEQNLWWAAGYNIAAIPLAAGVLAFAGFLLPPAMGAMVMSISTVIVAINAKLLKRDEGPSGHRRRSGRGQRAPTRRSGLRTPSSLCPPWLGLSGALSLGRPVEER